MKEKDKKMLFFCMHPLNNVPPPLNAAIYFGNLGYKVIVVCYHDEGFPRIERLGTGARLLRLDLKSRRVRITVFRYVFAIIEFLWKCKIVLNRTEPNIIVTFNEIASILQFISFRKEVKKTKKIAWLLEFPENLERSFGKSIVFNLSIRSWKYAETIIVPTKERLAMACVLQPDLIKKALFIVHNASLMHQIEYSRSYSQGFYKVREFVEDPLRKTDLKIIYAGAIGNRYGLHELILAVGNSELPLSLLVLGKKHALSLREYEEAVADTKYKNRVEWIDSIDYREMTVILPWFDVGYVTYLGDTLNTYFAAPGKLYEYLKAGLIILADSGITLHEDLLQHQCGIFFDKPARNHKISDQLALLARDPDTVARMKANARRLFKEKYCFEKQIVKLTDHLN